MNEIHRLSQDEAQQFNVVVPEGGYRRMLRSYDQGHRDTLLVQIEAPDGSTAWLMVTPLRDEVTLDPRNEEVYVVNRAVASFVDPETYEDLPDHPQHDVWLNINTSVTALGMPAGILKMWGIPLDITEIGA